jgi:hypothetical protein
MNWLFEMRALRMPHPSNASRTRIGEIDLACGALPNRDCSWVDFSEKNGESSHLNQPALRAVARRCTDSQFIQDERESSV